MSRRRRICGRRDKGAPLRILQLHGTFDLGGKEARLLRLMNHWGGKASHDLLVGDPQAIAARAGLSAAVPVRFLDAPPLHGPPSFGKFKALARLMGGYDLVLSFNWGAMDGVMAHRLFRRLKCLPPLIHHEDGFNEDEALVRKASRNQYRRLALGGAYALVVPSSLLARIATQEWHRKPAKVHQIPNGIDVAAYAGPRAPTAIPGLVPDGRLIVGTLAGLRPVKNLRRLVRAVAPLRDQLRLVIVGQGEEHDLIRAEAASLGLNESDVLMPGFLPNPADYVGLFDIFALSSDSEQLPISLVEAMAAGLPAVCTDVGDIAGMVAPRNRAFIIDPADEAGFRDALAQLATSAALRESLGEANRLRARQCFDDAGMFQRYARLYGGAVGDELALA